MKWTVFIYRRMRENVKIDWIVSCFYFLPRNVFIFSPFPVCVCTCLRCGPSVCACVWSALYPCFKASVSLMRLSSERSSLGLWTCSASQTLSSGTRRISSLSRSHSHTFLQVVCVAGSCSAPPLIAGFPEQSESLSMGDNLSVVVYLSFSSCFSHTSLRPAAMLSNLMFMDPAKSGCSSTRCCQRSFNLLFSPVLLQML